MVEYIRVRFKLLRTDPEPGTYHRVLQRQVGLGYRILWNGNDSWAMLEEQCDVLSEFEAAVAETLDDG